MRLSGKFMRRRGEAAFTMIEIAISLAIIGFALVAIIGVLPIGLNVQRDNREETIINHDVNLFMDAIRNGSRGSDDMTNYVFGITNIVQEFQIVSGNPGATNPLGPPVVYGYSRFGSSRDGAAMPLQFPINTGARIIGLLGTPKYLLGGAGFYSNHVVAYVRALSGPASEKFPQGDASVQELAFSYRLVPEVVRSPAYDVSTPYGKNLQANVSDLRLLFRWPLLPNGEVGPSRQAYRSQIGGQVQNVNDTGQTLYFFLPNTYTNVATTP